MACFRGGGGGGGQHEHLLATVRLSFQTLLLENRLVRGENSLVTSVGWCKSDPEVGSDMDPCDYVLRYLMLLGMSLLFFLCRLFPSFPAVNCLRCIV